MKKTESIPKALREIPHWVNWKNKCNKEDPKKKPKKAPINPHNGRLAKVNDSSTWATFDVASTSDKDKIGFVLTDTAFIGIDVDYLIDHPTCKEFITKFSSTYCEKSPNGNLRIFCLGTIKRAGKGTTDKAIEIYDKTSPRYLTCTGDHIENSALEVTNCQPALDWAHEKYFQKPTKQSQKPVNGSNASKGSNPTLDEKNASTAIYMLSDDEILQKCKQAKNASKFESLFSGGGNDDESSGDLALAGIFTFYTKDTNQLDKLMRSSNRNNLKNGKWDKKHHSDGSTYGQKTLEKAINSVKESYSTGVKNTRGRNYNGKQINEEKLATVLSQNNWYRKLAIRVDRNGNAKIVGNLHNMVTILQNDKNLKGLFSFNEFTSKVEVLKPNTPVNLLAGEIEDDNVVQIRKYIAISYQQFDSLFVKWEGGEMLNAIVNVAKESYSFHPVKDYLNSLEWDGEKRIDHFFSDHCGVTYDEYSAFVAKSLFISLVARVMEPGCKVDTMVILEGNQGIGKSSLFRALCAKEEWFRDSALDLNSKDSYTALKGKWIIEIAELDSFNKADVTRIKNFLSSQSDSYRPPYGKCDIDVPRQCCPVGTTNKSDYLKDETGNRRFFPIKCEFIDLNAIIASRDQLFAEAVIRYQDGEKWYTEKKDSTLNERIKEEQAARYEGDAWQDIINEWAEIQEEKFTIAKVATDALKFEIKDVHQGIKIRIGKVLRSLGYEPSTNSPRTYLKKTQQIQQPKKGGKYTKI